MFSEEYVRAILALAPLVVCLAFSLEKQWWSKKTVNLSIVAAVLFGASVWSKSFAIWAALPWLGLCFQRALKKLQQWGASRSFEETRVAEVAAFLYLPVGGIWAVFDQCQFQPLGFSQIIVLLTGVHFHYAGFALPRLTGLWLSRAKKKMSFRLAAWGVIVGVPLVAIGITTSQLNMPAWIEVVAVSILAWSAFVVSLGQLHWAVTAKMSILCRVLFGLGGVALAFGMGLATIYGWRSVYPVGWATIPAMYAIHGTLNSLGFCLPGFIGWKVLGDNDA